MNTTSQYTLQQNRWDIAGITTSTLCILHCLMAPILITTLPVLAATEHQTHSIFAITIVLIGMLAFIPGYRTHRKISIPTAGLTGATMIIIAALLPEFAYAEFFETGLVLLGGTVLVIAHLRNLFWCRFCKKCQQNCCEITGNNGVAS